MKKLVHDELTILPEGEVVFLLELIERYDRLLDSDYNKGLDVDEHKRADAIAQKVHVAMEWAGQATGAEELTERARAR